jgi:hypothetical protein
MLSRLACLVLGHLPWRTVAETLRPVTPVKSFEMGEFRGSSSAYAHVTSQMIALQKASRGGKIVTLTCDRCGKLVTVEH